MHLNRLVSVLEAVAAAGRPLAAAEVQLATGLPRPTCYRLLQTLAAHRLLDDPGGNSRYQVGDRLVRIALLGKSDVDVRLAAASTMKEAAIDFGEAIFLSRFRSSSVEIIHVETPADPARNYIHPGLGYRPMHACSCSKVIAAFSEAELEDQLLSAPMKTYTEHTKTAHDALRREFSEIRAQGFAECVEEVEVGVSSVAAPIRLGDSGVTFSIGAVGPVRRFTPGYRVKVGNELMQLASKVGSALQLHG